MVTESMAAVRRYRELNFKIIPVRYKDKCPLLPDWTNRCLSDREIEKYFGNARMNIGVVLGKMSNGLFDVDCDCPEARKAARRILPETCVFGHQSNPKSHFLYYIRENPPDSKKFRDIDGSAIIEIRGDKCQTVVPPSVHTSGEDIVFYTDTSAIAEIRDGSELTERVSQIAAVALIARHYVETGSRNELAMTLAGTFLRHGMSADETEFLIRLIAKIAGDEEWKVRADCVENTLERLANKRNVYGVPKLKELLGEEVVSKVCEWLELNDEETPKRDNPVAEVYSDLTNTEYFVAEYGDSIHFCVDTRQWLCWDSRRWEPDLKDKTKQLVIKAIRSMYNLLQGIDDPKEQKELIDHIRKSESRPRIQAIQSLAESFDGIPVCHSELDSQDMLFNTLNCTLDLETGKAREHSKKDLITKLSPVTYNPDAECPMWEKFLGDVFQDDEELITFAQWSLGYFMTGDTSEESLWILYGKAQSGKSKFLSVVNYILGDYAGTAAMSTFTEKREMNTYDLATLSNVRFVTATEASDTDSFNEPLLKQLTGRDTIKCRPIYGRPMEYTPKFKIAIATNELPRIKSQGYDMKRRLKIMPFRQRFYEPDEGKKPVKDKHILRKLLAEAPGILNWMLRGCCEWHRHGSLIVPACVKAEITEVFEEQDTLAEFLAMYCEFDPKKTVTVSDLWKAYQSWLSHSGIDTHTAIKQPQGLSRNLIRRDGIERVRTTKGERALSGIGLKPFVFGKFDEF